MQPLLLAFITILDFNYNSKHQVDVTQIGVIIEAILRVKKLVIPQFYILRNAQKREYVYSMRHNEKGNYHRSTRHRPQA